MQNSKWGRNLKSNTLVLIKNAKDRADKKSSRCFQSKETRQQHVAHNTALDPESEKDFNSILSEQLM
jgi:hypothetical protein